MKKSKLSVGLVTSFIAAMTLSSCGASVTKDSKNLVDFTGNNGQSLSVSIDEIYKDYLESSAGISKYYEQVIEVLIRHAFQKDKAGSSILKGVKRNYNQILDTAKENVESAKEQAKSNADTNGTDRKTEWQSILSEKGVKDEEELLQYFIYKLEKEEIEDWYYENHKEALRQQYLGVKSNKDTGATIEATDKPFDELVSRYPYHIRHILVKNEEGANDYVRGTISADAAERLSSAVKLLADGKSKSSTDYPTDLDRDHGNTFGEVAKAKSEDGSSSSYGDVGLMTNAITTSDGKPALQMVKEFQLGIYAYDAIIKNGAGDRGTDDEHPYNVIDEGLGLDNEVNGEKVSTALKNYGIREIPYSVFVELGDVAKLESNYATGLTVEDNKSALYPRNLLWNRYLNNHGIFIITNGARKADYDPTGGAIPNEVRDVKTTEGLGTYYDPQAAAPACQDAYTKYDGTGEKIDYSKLGGFKKIASFGGNDAKRVLTDENRNVIIGVRSEFGIHLMIVEKSAYDYNDAVKLEYYYTTALPSDDEYKEMVQKGYIPAGEHTYVDFIYSDEQSEYKTRSDTIKSAIKGFDSTYEYRLYEELKALESVDASSESNKDMFNLIDTYIDLQREKNQNEQEEGLAKVWEKYFELLATQDYYRTDIRNTDSAATYNDRVVPEGCKIAFTKDLSAAEKAALKAQYEEGGYCYVK